MSNQITKYQTDTGEISLSKNAVRTLIATSDTVTDAEVLQFMALCKAHKLNPFIREAYLIKYGSNPATMVVGKDVFTKRAAKNPNFAGFEAGVTVLNKNGELERRDGSLVLAGEGLVGGWCSVHIHGNDVAQFDEVSFDEYAGRKKDGSLNGQWAKMPATMIRKVAIVHALREAFPTDFQGLYDSAEMAGAGVVDELSSEPIDVEALAEDARPWGEPVFDPEEVEASADAEPID